MHPGQFGRPVFNNEKLTAAFFTDMIVGQDGKGNSVNVQGLVPETYTLQFSYIQVEADVNGIEFIPNCKAIINWKIDGQQQRRVISIVSGASISGPCNGVDVSMVDDPTGGDATIGKKYKVQTTLARGLRANTQEPPTLTDSLVQSINSGSSATYQVPKDAGVTSLYVLVCSGNPADVFIDSSVQVVMSDNHLPSPGLLGSYYPLKCCHWVPLAPGTQKIVIFNGSGVEMFTQVIWGIDG
jgi:hypothetical protein